MTRPSTFMDYEQDWDDNLTWSQLYRRNAECGTGAEAVVVSTGDRVVISAPQEDSVRRRLGALQAGRIAVPLSVLGGVTVNVPIRY